MVYHFGVEYKTAEEERLKEDKARTKYWKKWGPYLSERQWATVREDYSGNGDAWSSFPHEHARSRTYRWGEDGLAGVSDTHAHLCISFAFWNEKDDILKERLFGLTGHQGNHGEDVKELYYYLDNTPTHSYMKYLYKYPQKKFPYEKLVEENAKRSRDEPEYELLDTGVFDEDRYFDIFIETAKDVDNPEELLFRITAYNRGPEPAPLHMVPQIWFRNTWSWDPENSPPKPSLALDSSNENANLLKANHYLLGDRYVIFPIAPGIKDGGPDISPELLFTDNQTNYKKLYKVENKSEYTKDGFHDYIIEGIEEAVNPKKTGTKAGAWYAFEEEEGIPPGGSAIVRFKLTNVKPASNEGSVDIDEDEFDKVFEDRINDADEFYFNLSPIVNSLELRSVERQALAGMLWTKQFYNFIQPQWIAGDPANVPPPPERKLVRNTHWKHLYIDDILSMPDKWEYPFFAAWDTAFHCIPLAMVDPEFAKKQLDLLTREWYMHPNGQIPAYEWNFSDVNPPVHAWATYRVFKIGRKLYGYEDLDFLERVFQKLLMNFTWWVNRKDADGNNVFEGGFLGLDNIGVFNRSEPLPTGGTLEQADSTGWMAFYSLNMLNIALELAKTRKVYEDIANKFFEHFLFIADAMSFSTGVPEGEEQSLWNEQDGFYYDSISWGPENRIQLPVRSLVGLIPLFAVLAIEPAVLDVFPQFAKRLDWFVKHRTGISKRNIAAMDERGRGKRLLLALVSKERLQRILQRMLDEDEFLSDYGIRSLSKYHKDHPYTWEVNEQNFTVDYVPGDSNSGMFGGNSNWRGPIWFPTNFLLIESLQRFHLYYGESLKVEFPKNSGHMATLKEVAEGLQSRLVDLFIRNPKTGRRACSGEYEKMDTDPHYKDYLQFHEFFNSDNGKGLGSTHQNGWTGLVAKIIHDLSFSFPRELKSKSKAADLYFDEILANSSNKKEGRHHLRRRSTAASVSTLSRNPSSVNLSIEDKEMLSEYREKVRGAIQNFQLGDDDDDYDDIS